MKTEVDELWNLWNLSCDGDNGLPNASRLIHIDLPSLLKSNIHHLSIGSPIISCIDTVHDSCGLEVHVMSHWRQYIVAF